jgi:Tfp pilus assembly protein PilN
MIVVNLLPPHLRPIQRTPLPYIGAFALMGLAIAAMISVFLSGQAAHAAARSQLAQAHKQLKDLESVVKEANALTEKKLALQTKILTIQEILADRIIWSRQLHRLASLAPENIWFDRIETTIRNFKEKRQKIDPKTGEPQINPRTKEVQTENITVKRPVLQVTGYAVTNEQGYAAISPFVEATEADPEFSQMFALFSPDLEDTDFEGYAVRKFELAFDILTPATGSDS